MLTTKELLESLKEYKALKKEVYHIKKLGIFGSYARGEAKEESDIDIVVDFEKADLFNQMITKDLQLALAYELLNKDIAYNSITKSS